MNNKAYRRILGLIVRVSSCALSAVLLLSNASIVHAEEWYIPKRTEVIEKGSLEVGGRFQFIADEDGVLNSREVSFIPSIRYSPLKRLEVYAELPLSYREEERVIAFALHSFNDEGYGDVFTQLSYEAFGGQDWKVTVSNDLVIPTGRDPFEHRVGLGGGFYRVTPGVSFMKIVDPAVLFLYLGHQWTKGEGFLGVGKINPGDDFRFRFGGTFLLNPRISATVYTTGDIIGHQWTNGVKIAGSDGEIFRFGSGLNWTLSERLRMDMYSTWGMTGSTTDAVISLGLTGKI